MPTFFETKITYEKPQDNGTLKRVTESYLVDALSVTEAEARLNEELIPYISGEHSVPSAKATKYAEVYHDTDGDKYYDVKVGFITLDEVTAVEKRTITLMLVQAPDFASAVANINNAMKGTMADWEIVSVAESKIVDVYHAKVRE